MNTIDFHKTTTKELLAIKDRVRLLINHWGEDGRYQEAVLKSVISRFLPEKFKIVTGFVINQTQERGVHEASKQIDIIIYNSEFPVLFKEGDFYIVTADSVEGIIEVKANLKNQGVENVVRKANEIGQFIYNSKSKTYKKKLFNGIFSFAGHERLKINNSVTVQNSIRNSENTVRNDPNMNAFKVNHISFNKDKFYKYWNQSEPDDGGILYEINDLSFSFLISNLIAHLKSDSVFSNNKLWFPVEKSLKAQRI
ncbi:DUF6602 domain-containing protein [Lutimonas vermicola]|uniref:DUF6602 domain-containing protein n=1 Tax=Lutimonas vermicola TaxID=414288 RepID=A0ABU9L4M5_9FLAO